MFGHRFVERIKIRILDQAIAFEGPHQNRHRAVFLAPGQHVDGIGQAQQRQHADPAQPAVALLPDIGHPAVVGFADRHFELGLVGDLLDKDGRIHHLNIDAHLVHVADARLDIFEVLRLRRHHHVAATGFGEGVKILRLDHMAHVAADLAVDQPELPVGVGAGID